MSTQQQKFQLPTSIISPTDVARLSREIEEIDNYFRQQEIRNSGESNTPPRLSKLLDQLISYNQMNLLRSEDRTKVLGILKTLHSDATVMHISFSVDPPGSYLQKIVDWLRRNIHAYVLVTVGLQPNIGAGCIVRTTNKMFDFSLREYFNQKREFFIEKLHSSVFEVTQPEQPVSSGTQDAQDGAMPAQNTVSQQNAENSAPATPTTPTTPATPATPATPVAVTAEDSTNEAIPALNATSQKIAVNGPEA